MQGIRSKTLSQPQGNKLMEVEEMTLINALNELKAKGITKLVGMVGKTDINEYIGNAKRSHDDDIKWADVSCHKYSLDHEDDNYMITTNDGHHIITTIYGTAEGKPFNMATYSDYETEEEMNSAFDEYEIKRKAEEIADKMTKSRPDELPRMAWVLIATSELKAAYKASKEAFEREYAIK